MNHKIINIASFILVAMFFSCGNDLKEVQDFLAEKNLPIGIAKNIYSIQTDSGLVKTKLIAPVLHDFSNRENHPYMEFPEGLKVVTYDKKGDSVVLIADYSVTYTKTNISEVRNNVNITNYSDSSKLITDQLFWDANEHYIYTEKKFILITKTDTIHGVGFESNEDLSKLNMKSIRGTIYVKENP
jgi:LPS export ABC transporter protein LptC